MDEVADLRADCARCSALCCVALPYAASADFAYDKPAGRPCRHLDDFVVLHPRPAARTWLPRLHGVRLPRRGTAGHPAHLRRTDLARSAGPRGRDLRRVPDHASAPGAALVSPSGRPRRPARRASGGGSAGWRTRRRPWPNQGPEELLQCDVAGHRAAVDDVLSEVSRRVRRAAVRAVRDTTGRPRSTRRADLVGAEARRRRPPRLRLPGRPAARRRSAACDLRGADLIGADLRAADLRGADLSTALYVTEPQVTRRVAATPGPGCRPTCDPPAAGGPG